MPICAMQVKAALKAYFDSKDCAGTENREAANVNFSDFLAEKPGARSGWSGAF
jgi:hypothetical protein